jgi:hypothetical protein
MPASGAAAPSAGRTPDGQRPRRQGPHRAERGHRLPRPGAAHRLASEPGYLRQANTLERLSSELADVLAKLITADRRHHQEAG